MKTISRIAFFLGLMASAAAQTTGFGYGAQGGQVTPAAPSGGAGTFSSVTDTGLTSGRLVLVGTGGLLRDSANFTYVDGTTTGQLIIPVGAAATPSLTFLGDADNGLYYATTNSFGVATAGVPTLVFSGGAAAVLTGGAGNMTIVAGTGASRTLALQTTTAGSAAATALTLDASQNATFAGNITLGASTSQITGAAGNMTILSGTGVSRTLILQTTTSGSVATTALTLDDSQRATFAGKIRATSGSAASGGILFNAGNANSGFYYISSDGVGIATNGAAAATFDSSGNQVLTGDLTVSGGDLTLTGTTTVTGGAGNMTITSGTGASRTLTMRTTTSGSAATAFLVADAAQGVTLGSLAGTGSRAVLADVNGLLSAPVSDENLKEPLRPLPDAYGLDAVMRLQPSIFKFKDKDRFGSQDYIGFGARATSRIIPEITGQDKNGVYYLNDEKLTAVLVKAVQQQQHQIRALWAVLLALALGAGTFLYRRR